MLALAALVTLFPHAVETAAPAPAPAPAAAMAQQRVLVMSFKVDGAPPEMGSAVANIVAVALGKTGRFDVVTAKDLQALLDREANKQSLGACDAKIDSCLAEIAGALGAGLVVYGDVSKLDTRFLVNVNLFDATHAVGLGRENVEVASADELPGRVAAAARTLVDGDTGPGAVPIAAAVVAGVGVAAAVVASVGALAAYGTETDPRQSGTAKTDALQAHPLWSTTAAASAAVAVGAAIIALATWGDS